MPEDFSANKLLNGKKMVGTWNGETKEGEVNV